MNKRKPGTLLSIILSVVCRAGAFSSSDVAAMAAKLKEAAQNDMARTRSTMYFSSPFRYAEVAVTACTPQAYYDPERTLEFNSPLKKTQKRRKPGEGQMTALSRR